MDVWLMRGDDVVEDVGNFAGAAPDWLRKLDGKTAEDAAKLTSRSELGLTLKAAARRQIERFGGGLTVKVIEG